MDIWEEFVKEYTATQKQVDSSPVEIIDGIPVVKVHTEFSRRSKATKPRRSYFPQVPMKWGSSAIRAGSNAARLMPLIAYRYKTTGDEWFTIPAKLLRDCGLNRVVRSRGLQELVSAGLIELRGQGSGRPLQVKVLGFDKHSEQRGGKNEQTGPT